MAIAGLSAIETMRRPVCLLLAVLSVMYMCLSPIVIAHTFGEAGKLIRDSNLAVFIVGGLLLGTFAACYSLSNEIRKGTASAIVAKPVNRMLFLLAKYCGVAVFMLSYAALSIPAIIMSSRAAAESYQLDLYGIIPLFLAPVLGFLVGGALNFFAQRPFASNAYVATLIATWVGFVITGFIDAEGAWAGSFGSAYNPALLGACLLLTLAMLVLQAISVLLATRLDVVPTLTLCTVIFLLGLTSDALFGRVAETQWLAGLAYRLIPNWSHFWLADALNAGGRIAWSYVLSATGYAAAYTAGILAIAAGLVQKMEMR